MLRDYWRRGCSGNGRGLVWQASSSLPIAAHFQDIVNTVSQNQVSIIQGSTGSGKTTQVPQYILDFEDGSGPKTIIVTQPRRLAAMTVARRVAAERGEPLGASVGYAIRFDSVWPQRPGGICYMTSGLLLKRLHFRGLCGISHVIVDEVISIDGHNFDVKVLYLEDVIEKMGSAQVVDLKNDKQDASKSMNTCDVKRYSPSTVQALKAMPEHRIPLELTRDLLSTLVKEGTVSAESGSVLVFLPTWSIMSILSKLIEADEVLSRHCKVIMLHSQVPKNVQMEAFHPAPAGLAKVILATNIAESSITIDDVTCVIDSCRVKLTFFSETTKLSYTDVVFTGRHNLEQRKGRAGRTRPGLCFRLCTQQRFMQGLQEEVPPELTRMPLVGAALLVKSLELGDIATVLSQCPDPPSEALVVHAIKQLTLVRALDDEQHLTSLGRILARLPLDPHVGLALLMGHWFFGLGDAMCTLCAAMSFDEPFHFEKTAGYLPWSISQKYQGSHKHSDQYVLGLVHQEYARLIETVGENSSNRFVASEGLHPAIMRQVYDASEQLRSLLQTDALGALGMGGPEPLDEDAIGPSSKKRSYTAIRDWGPQEWQWGAILLALATALPHVAVHQEKRHLWVEEDARGAVHKSSVNCCKNSFVFPTPLFAFLDRTQEEGWRPARCRQLTNIPPLLALLKPFSHSEIRMDGE
ncbi:dhx9, partial [Symbiodinium pilosum]